MASLLLLLIYICFISLGLPDSLLGASWPTMYPKLDVPVSYAGIIAMLISTFTVISSLLSDKLTKKFSVGIVIFVSVLLSAGSMIGFSIAPSFWLLLILTIPYGLGAGSIDAALNNYVALHFKASHMSWLHCMWGLGAMISPYIMGLAITNTGNYTKGYFIVAVIQLVIALITLLAMPLWKKQKVSENIDTTSMGEKITIKSLFNTKGLIAIAITFFCYCALEQTAMLWTSSYLNLKDGVNVELAASLASLPFIGITIGRAINGFLTYKLNDTKLIRIGSVIIFLGIIVMFLPFGKISSCLSLFLIGFGCAPIYPCIMHSTPIRFGANASQVIIGIQMAAAYMGIVLMPPLFGIIAEHISISLFPVFLCVLLIVMFIMHEVVIIKTKKV